MIAKVMPLSFIIALRFFGLFIVMPVLSVYALGLKNADEITVGIVIGGYALTQMVFQLPFGMLSDKIGRKKTLLIGLVIFALGSIVCALSNDIYTLMFGRFLQGAGAIGAVVTAMISDSVKEEIRAKAMAVMGGSIALSFAFAMFLGPVIGGMYGVDKLFWLTAVLAFVAIVILYTKVPTPPVITHEYEDERLSVIFKNKDLMKMNITHFLQKGFMTVAFLTIPILLIQNFGWEMKELYKAYIPALILGLLAMGPAAVLGEKKGKYKEIFILSIVLFAASFLLMNFAQSQAVFIVATALFFVAFNMFEPLMQSLTTKYAKVHQKGTALGVANASAYFGTFLGGLLGGIIIKYYSIGLLFNLLVAISVFWVLMTLSMKNPARMKNLYLAKEGLAVEKISAIAGVIEYYTNETDNTVVIKYDTAQTDETTIKSLLA
jgi:MFS family permease